MKRILIGLALVGLGMFASAGRLAAQQFMGFELLDLDGALVRWSSAVPGQAPHLTYAIAQTATSHPGARNCTGLSPVENLLTRSSLDRTSFATELRAAFDLWEHAANIEFAEIADAKSADIVIGAQTHPVGRAFTNVAYRQGGGPVRSIERSLICLNPERPWKIGFDGNLEAYDLRYTLAHEIGHAIGLDHPSPTGQLMSFRYDENFRQLQGGDLNGVASIYGLRSETSVK